MDGRIKTIAVNRYAQVYSNDKYFSKPHPRDNKGKAGDTLKELCRDFGVPVHSNFDGSKKQTCKGTTFMQMVRHFNIDYQISEPELHNQNPAEVVTCELRKKWFRTMIRNNFPKKLWGHGITWCSEVMPFTHSTAGSINVVIPLEQVTGETLDISEHLDFGF